MVFVFGGSITVLTVSILLNFDSSFQFCLVRCDSRVNNECSDLFGIFLSRRGFDSGCDVYPPRTQRVDSLADVLGIQASGCDHAQMRRRAAKTAPGGLPIETPPCASQQRRGSRVD